MSTMREYTAEERLALSKIFGAAIALMWDGQPTKKGDEIKERYICHAINKLKGEFGSEACRIAEEEISWRLGGAFTMESWLIFRGLVDHGRTRWPSVEKKVQAHRIAWLKLLEDEFKPKKLIYVCKCGCPRLRQDATVGVNDPSDVDVLDGVLCPECGYDGRFYSQVEVNLDFDMNEDLEPEYVELHGKEVVL